MDKNVANNLMVGGIVTVGFIGFLFIVFSVGGGSGFLTSQYRLFGKFKDVKGLHSGSEVALSGLRIGVVQSITISQGKELIVEMMVSNDIRNHIRRDSAATIRTQGVLGDKYIEVSIGSPNEPILEDDAYISTEQDEDIFTKGGDLVSGISKQFEEGGDIKEILQNVNSLVLNLNGLLKDVKKQQGLANALFYGQGGKSLNASLLHLNGILQKIDKGEGSLGALINDPTVYEDVKNLMGGAKRSNILKYFMRSFIDDGNEATRDAEE